eukprot:172912_1
MYTRNCYDVEYINQIIQNENDELLPTQILSSSNCEFILIRIPPCIVSFYSILDESIIDKWTLNKDDSIWSLYPSDYTQKISITNDGCLNFVSFSNNNTVLHNICSNSDEYLSSENQFMNSEHSNSHKLSLSSGANSNQSINSVSHLLNSEIIWIPILFCFIGALFIILCCFLNKQFFDKKDMKIQSDLTDEEEFNGTNNTKIYDDENEIDSFDYVADDLHVNLDNIEDDWDTDYSENDNYDIENDDDDDDNNFVFDLRGRKLVSQDITVINHILTPSNKDHTQNRQNIMI